MSDYRFQNPPERSTQLSPLEPGEYDFTVQDCDPEPYESKAGNQVLAVRLSIPPSAFPIFAYPWSGTTRDGEYRDGIAEFLLCIDRAPAVGQEPDWSKIPGAKGRCRLEVEIAEKGALKGQPINRVAWFHLKRQTKPPD